MTKTKSWYDKIMERDKPPTIEDLRTQIGMPIPLQYQFDCLLLCWLHRKELKKKAKP